MPVVCLALIFLIQRKPKKGSFQPSEERKKKTKNKTKPYLELRTLTRQQLGHPTSLLLTTQITLFT